MGATKVQDTPPRSAKKSAKKRSRTSLASTSVAPQPSVNEQPKSPRTPVRQRRRASDFASKISSSKKRPRNRATPVKASSKKVSEKSEHSKEEEASVDEILQQVRDLMKSKSTTAKTKALAEALKKADEAFEHDISGSSSCEEEEIADDPRITSDAKALDDEAHASRKAKESARRSASTPGKQKKRSNESQSTRVTAEPRKSSLNKEDSSDEEADPGRHKAEIEALKRDDPTFYKFLEENDGSLLDFDMSDDSEHEEDPKINGNYQQKVENTDGEDSESDDNSGHENQGHIVRDKNLRDTSKKIPKATSRNDTEKDLERTEDADFSGSEVSTSDDDDDDDDARTTTRVGPTRQELDKMGSKSESKKSDKSIGAVEDVDGYSDDDDDDDEMDEAEAEAEAAAEAGLEVNDASDSDTSAVSDEEPREPNKGKRKMIFVDMKYLRELKELLKSKRSSLKACKDLLRLFRAGRDILPSSPVSKDKKAKQAMSEKKFKKSAARKGPEFELEDNDLDVYRDDGSFTAGKVRFASSKSYQQAMNLAIIGLQDALDKMLGKPKRKEDTIEPLEVTWDPTDSSRWINLEPIFRPYVFHLLALCDATEDAATLRFLLWRLEKLVPYTRENKVLLKRIMRVPLRVWASDRHHIGEKTRLRSYVLLARLAHGPGNAEIVLRGCCNAYATNVANVCNPKTLPLIHFATCCLVELFGIDMGASYTTAFSVLREMAVSLRAVLISKDRREEVERIHNWSYINKLRLLSKVLGQYGSEHELRPLIYPYVQICIGVMRTQPTPRTIPLRLHVASYLSDLTGETGVFIPVVPQLLSLLRCSELRKKSVHGSVSGVEWRSVLRVSEETVKTKPFLTGVINGVVYGIAKYLSIISKHISFPEVAHFAEVTLKKASKELAVIQWRQSVTCLAQKIHETSKIISDARSKGDLSPHGAIHSDGMLAIVTGIDKERKMPITRLFEVEQARVMKEERLRDEKQSEKKSGSENGMDEVREEEGPAKKRRRMKKEDGRKKSVSLSVPEVNDSDDEDDQVAELSLDSDDDEEDDVA